MPQAPDNRIPPSKADDLEEYVMPAKKQKSWMPTKQGLAQRDAVSQPETLRRSSSQEQLTLERRGVLPWPSWGWQLAGLITATVTGIMLIWTSLDARVISTLVNVLIGSWSIFFGDIDSFSFYWDEFPVVIFILGIGLLIVTVYCGVQTNWLTEVSTASQGIKIGTGTSIICGLISIISSILYAAAVILPIVLLIAFGVLAICAMIYAMLALLGDK